MARITEIQTLFARKNAYRPNETEVVWVTTKKVANVYEARKQRTPDQRIVRNHTSMFPATVVSHDGRRLHVFDNPITPYATVKAEAIRKLAEAPQVVKADPVKVAVDSLRIGEIIYIPEDTFETGGAKIPAGEWIVLYASVPYAFTCSYMIRKMSDYMNGETRRGWMTYCEPAKAEGGIGRVKSRDIVFYHSYPTGRSGNTVEKRGRVILYTSESQIAPECLPQEK